MCISRIIGLILGAVLAASTTAFVDDPVAKVTGAIASPLAKRFPTVVYLEGAASQGPASSQARAAVDQKGKVFIPRVLPVQVGTTVDFLNSDGFEHNVFSPEGKYDLGSWGQGNKRSHTFSQPGVYTQLCKLHPEMVSYVVVLETPYFTVADSEGKFQIDKVPAGSWKLKVWNERLKSKQLGKAWPVEAKTGQVSTVEVAF